MFVELVKDFLGQKAGQRIDVSEADAQTLLAAGTAQAVAGDPLADAVGKALGEALGKLTNGLEGAVDDALQQLAQARTLSRKNAGPRLFGESGRGDPDKTFGRFLLAVRFNDHRTLEEMGSTFAAWSGVEGKAALNVAAGSATQGGYTVPTEFLPRLMGLAAEMSVVRPRATVIPMTARSIQVPALDVVTAPAAGDTAFFGGLVARWNAEANTVNETEPQFKQVELVAHEL